MLPFLLWKMIIPLWLWWREELHADKLRAIVLEVSLPKENVKPVRAMENVMAAIHGTMFKPPDWWETWVEGEFQPAISFEIASLGGEPHFFIRVPSHMRAVIDSAIYAQYPDAEIREVEDYTKSVPQDIPNAKWDMFGYDMKLAKPDPYPIKTYRDFETESEHLEEKRIDPISNLMESLSKIHPGEQIWIQMRAVPLAQDSLKPFLQEGEAIKNKLVHRREKKKGPSFWGDLSNLLFFGKKEEQKEEKEDIIPSEMKLTPVEREVVEAVEHKTSKPAFSCNVRCIYLGKREVFVKLMFRLPFGFFSSFSSAHLNAIVPWGETLTKIHKSWFLPMNRLIKRRLYLRARRMFRYYVWRFPPIFGFSIKRFFGAEPPRNEGVFVLNTEELASLFHFPIESAASAASVPRVEFKKGEAPSHLPLEEE